MEYKVISITLTKFIIQIIDMTTQTHQTYYSKNYINYKIIYIIFGNDFY